LGPHKKVWYNFPVLNDLRQIFWGQRGFEGVGFGRTTVRVVEKLTAMHYGQKAGYAASVVDDRIVDQGEVITARGVTSAIDLGLYLCEKLAGHEAKEQTRQQMDYPYRV
jgi:hypothetical protein